MVKYLRKIILKPLLTVRAQRLGSHIHRSTSECSSLLDVGGGDMVLADHLSQNYSTNITSIDTIDSNLTTMPVKLYDGKRIPFDAKSFDATMAVFVLHHCDSAEDVIREMVRVTRKKIIIFEEVYHDNFSRLMLQWHDRGNIFYSSKMAVPLNFKTRDEWHTLFSDMSLKNIQSQRVSQYPIMNMTHQVCFEIEL